ncbi:MAG TPA: PAS domain-containing protein [Alphaproteobacteria bacterium]|nr:PAS domain-containing protein [Alphaproteobacteria bacterium]
MLPEPECDGLPERIEDADFRGLYRYWDERRGDRFAPRRDEIDPLDLVPLIGDLLLIDVVREGTGAPPRFRFRLHGTRLTERAGYDMTGRFAEELPYRENREQLLARFASLVAQRRPEYGLHDRIVDFQRWRYEVLWLPLANGGGDEVAMLLGAMRYRDTVKTATPLAPEQRETLEGD